MASEEEKKQLLLLTPLLFKQAPSFPHLLDLNAVYLAAISSQRAQAHTATVKAFQDYTKFERARTRPVLYPRPEQGGRRITKHLINSLGDAVCLYRFRYVNCTIIHHSLQSVTFYHL